MRSFEEVWKNMVDCKIEEFSTIQGLRFRYKAVPTDANQIPDSGKRQLRRNHVINAQFQVFIHMCRMSG